MRKLVTIAIASTVTTSLLASCTSTVKGKDSRSASPLAGPVSSTSSSSDPTPADLKKAVIAAMRGAQSFHLEGTVIDDNGKPIQLDIHFGPNQTAAGSVAKAGETIQLINPGGPSLYFKAPDSLWRQEGGDAAVARFHDKWVKVAVTDKRFTDLASSFNKTSFLDELLSRDSGIGDLRKIGPATMAGIPATEYESPDRTHVYLAASGAPVILKLVKAASVGGTITFSDYDKPYPVNPPPADQTVDVAVLEHQR